MNNTKQKQSKSRIAAQNISKKKIGRPRTVAQVPLDFPVKLIAVPENSVDFNVRKNEVQHMIVKMILRRKLQTTDKKKSFKSK